MYVDHTAKLSGGEIALSRLLPGLKSSVSPIVVLGEDGPLVPRLRALGVEVRILPLSPHTRQVRKDSLTNPIIAAARIASVLGYSLRLRRLIRAHDVDIVHTNSLKAGFYGCLAARLAGVPSVWHLRDRLSPDYLPRFALWATRVALAVLPNRVVCNSAATLATVPKRLQNASLRRRPLIVPSPIHDVLELDEAGDVSDAPASDSTEDRPFAVGLVGRFAPWKGQLEAVRAFAEEGMPPSARLSFLGAPMFGEESYEESVRDEVARLELSDRVQFCGFVDDVMGAIRRLDVLLHASTVPEPFGQVVVEGMAAGVPVVATRGGGPSEIITDGVDGLLYTAGDAQELVAHITRLWSDAALRQRLRAAGLRRAQDFSPQAIAPSVIRLYEQLLGAGGRTAV
jgi:glycosyltransferase involved in cell wall biosynthesis